LKPLNIVDAAEAEFRNAFSWYRNQDPRVGDRFAAQARETLRRIESFPQIGGRVSGISRRDIRRMPIHKFPYYVIFINLADRLEVVAFAHYRRRPGYFMSRVRPR
jgi:toxin ParE1/3/4